MERLPNASQEQLELAVCDHAAAVSEGYRFVSKRGREGKGRPLSEGYWCMGGPGRLSSVG